MPTILIVDDEEIFLKAIEDYFETSSHDLGLFLAKNGKEAIRIIEKNPVDLVVTDLMMPEMDGFELLAFLNDHFPFIPTIVVTGYGTPEIEEKLKNLGSFAFMEKPVRFKELEDTILYGLEEEHGKGSISGVSIAGFIQLVDSDQKTCLLEARKEGTEPGYLYFNKGELWDAMCGGLRGKEAAIEIIGWEEAEIYFKSLPKKEIGKRIESQLMSLIIEAVKHKDETSCRNEKSVPVLQEFSDVIDNHQKSDLFAEDPERFFSFELSDKETAQVPTEKVAEEALPDAETGLIETPGPLSRALGEFLEISGVEAVMVVAKDGSVLTSSESCGAIDMAKVGVSVAMVLQGAEKMGGELEISAFQHLMLESDDTVIVCAPIGDAFLVLVAHDSQRLGMIRLRIKKKMPDMEIDFTY